MPTNWEKAPQSVLNLAQELIEQYHEHLLDARIGFVFRETGQVTGGRLTVGQASKVSAKEKVYSNLDFIIWLAADFWRYSKAERCRALLDHELCHCQLDPNTDEWKIRPHDFEEFKEIIDRYGFWSDDLYRARETFAQAVQDVLPGFEDKKDIEKMQGILIALEPSTMQGVE